MFVQNIGKDFFLPEMIRYSEFRLSYLDSLVELRFNIPVDNISVVSGLLLEGGRKKKE